MLARAHRLTSGREFADAIRRGRRAGTSTVVLHYLAPGEKALETPPRVGLVVGKGVGNAVTRNKVKRRIRHLVRERLSELPRGAVLVVRALPPAGNSSVGLAGDLDTSLQRLTGARR